MAIFDSKRKIETIVGIDFGTSFTKLAYSIAGASSSKTNIYPMRISSSDSDQGYIIPSLIASDGDGVITAGEEAQLLLKNGNQRSAVRYLKMLVASRHDQSFYDQELEQRFDSFCSYCKHEKKYLTPENLTAFYLADTMRKCRLALSNTYQTEHVNINFNVCVPIDALENKNSLTAFCRIAYAAELLESEWDKWSNKKSILQNIQSIQKDVPDEIDDSRRIHLIPEAIAQIASFLASDSVESCKYMIVDIGSGTTDVSIFEATKNDKTTYWYSSQIIPRGMRQIEDYIFMHYQHKYKTDLNIDEIIEKIIDWNGNEKAIKGEAENHFSHIWQDTHLYDSSIDPPVMGAMNFAYGNLEKNRKQELWTKDKLKVLICGGGAILPFLSEIFTQNYVGQCIGRLDQIMPEKYGHYATIASFDRLNNMESVSFYEFYRIQVAYGLAFPYGELRHYTLPKDVQDQPPTPLKQVQHTFSLRGVNGPVYDDDK